MRAILVTVVLLAVACTAEVKPSELGPSLPVALLSCPAEAHAGEPFAVDGSASRDLDGTFADVRLRVLPGDQELTELSGTFTVAASGIATVSLVVADADGNVAEARCRLMVRGAGGGPGDPSDPSDPSGPEEPGQPVDLNGDFALVAYDRPELQGGALDPARQCATSPQLSLVHLEHDGAQVSLSVEACAMTLPTVQVWFAGLQESTVPDAVVDAVPVIGPITWQLERAETGATFAPPPTALAAAQVLGASLTSATDALPTDAMDERVTDDDNNGEPGVSILSTFGPQNIIVRRVVRALSGIIASSDEIDGTAEGSYRVDTDSSLLSPLGFLVPTGAGLPSTFGMVRADGRGGALDLRGADGALDCVDLRAAFAELQARVPAPALPADCPSF
ncbi:MAG: hypothetical protein A2138_01675 [Deltaproteobacteria bacterium RBG_16_71_12]|nr:MAG: hypothetical protein A2138_01675 [Deltaproteobacteria bacterium RBG_16_71_12]